MPSLNRTEYGPGEVPTVMVLPSVSVLPAHDASPKLMATALASAMIFFATTFSVY